MWSRKGIVKNTRKERTYSGKVREGLELGCGPNRCYSNMGIPIFKTPVIWASYVTLTLTQIAKVIWEGDAHIPRVLGMGMPISL